MCGILAAYDLQGALSQNMFEHALQLLNHRGPDGRGTMNFDFRGPNFRNDLTAPAGWLGHTRLSILDLSSSGAQPMICQESGLAVVFNGEIYNFIEVRKALEALGITSFRSSSDTEVLLAAYRQWGLACFSKFNGMWACAIYDPRNRCVVLSRDRMGVKPLYFFKDAHRFIASSEIKPIISLLGTMPEINKESVYDFLAFGLSEHIGTTFFTGIVEVPPGQTWCIRDNLRLERHHYHRWPELSEEPVTATEVHDLIEDSLQLRLRSDAPTATLLSGGLDSSIITCLAYEDAQKVSRSKFVGSISYGYLDEEHLQHDEVEKAASLIRKLSADLTHRVLRVNAQCDPDEMLKMCWHQEMPFCTPSILASYRVYKELNKLGVKVALTGEGADELFGGYVRRYMPLLVKDLLQQGKVSDALTLLMRLPIPKTLVANKLGWLAPTTLLRNVSRNFRPNYAVIEKSFFDANRDRFSVFAQRQRQPLQIAMSEDVTRYNLPMILRFADRNSMAHGVELRLPFMDYRVVELSRRIAVASKLNPETGKVILREAFASSIPEEISTRKKTHGFGHAEQFEFLKTDWRACIEDVKDDLSEFIDVNTLLSQISMPPLHTTAWYGLSLALWLQTRRYWSKELLPSTTAKRHALAASL